MLRRYKLQIQNERLVIITNTIFFKWIIKDYYKKHYVHKFDNLEETDLFLERRNTPKVTQ